ncbi:MAG TPA: tripartite tricarboxylate transporter substrate binding protein [Casimicrobiaceae bacterium]|jgi:tripartite-type tricarboxylate transporter receptor subunit TctC
MFRFVPMLLACLALAMPAQAQGTYPEHPIRIIVPFPPGGPTDVLARLVGDQLSQSLGQAFVIENKPGAGGNIGMELGAKAAPDGYTLILAPVGNLTVSPYIYSKLPYDPQHDFAPVTVLAAVPNILVVNAGVPARSVRELIALAKAKPGTLNFASPGNGSGAHLAGELLKRMAGVDLVHVPYNGVAPAMNAVLAGDVQMFFAQTSAALPHLKSGRVVALGVASLRRIDAAPDLPTLAESGLPGFDVTSWYSLVAPAGTPPDRIARVQSAVARAFAKPEVREKIAGLGAEPVADTPAEFAALLQSESARWRALAREANIHVD